MRTFRMRNLTFLLIITSLSVLTLGQAQKSGKPTSVDWPTFLFNSAHSSATSSNAITSANAGTLIEAWHWQAGQPTIKGQPVPSQWASPIVSNGTIYIGSDTGVFYALNLTTGQVIWQQFLGFRPKLTCNAKGISATATIAPDPVTQKPTVYVPGGNGYLYALDAATGTINWQSVIALPSPTANDYYNWSSPNVANGMIYVGVSAQCDTPLVDNTGVEQFDQATGNLLNQYFSIRPAGYIGASVWSSVAVTSDSVFAATGNPTDAQYPKGVTSDDISIVRLDPNTLAKLDKWHLVTKRGTDQDFGAPPAVFTAQIQGVPTEMVGVSDKNGTFYALNSHDLKAGPVWKYATSAPPITPTVAAAAWDGTNLYVAGNRITINGTKYQGSISQINPNTGVPVWQTPLEGGVLGTPSINGSGILAVSTLESVGGIPVPHALNATYLINSSGGAILNQLSVNNDYEWSQPTFVGNYLLTGVKTLGLFAYNPSSQIFFDGFESGNLSNWTKHYNVTVEKTVVKDGTYAAEAIATGKIGAYANRAITPGTDVTMSAYIYIKSESTTTSLLTLKDTAGKMLLTLNVNAKGTLGSINGTTGTYVVSPSTVSLNTWHLLQVHLADASSGQASVRLDGEWIPKLSKNQTFSGVPVGTIQFGDSTSGHIFDVVYDDINVQVPAVQ